MIYSKHLVNSKADIISIIILALMLSSCQTTQSPKETQPGTLRFATFNTALFRDYEGGLIDDLQDTGNLQAKHVAAIIQQVNPDILALQEFDYDPTETGLNLFIKNYLERGQFGIEPIHFEYHWAVPSNTGIPSGKDLNNDGSAMDPVDAFGFGRFPGQYAFAILSKYPFDPDSVRSFQQFLLKDMPGASWPVDPESGEMYYSEAAMEVFRLSSKNHVDVPILTPNGTIHAIVAHPTPPVFDGEEDRNGMRNYDEIRFLADYISGDERSLYIYDDRQRQGGLRPGNSFVIMGDMNADPVDGDSYNSAIRQLLDHPGINAEISYGKLVPLSQGSEINASRNPGRNNKGNPAHDTSIWGLRIDYVLPSKDLKTVNSGVFWPDPEDPLHFLVQDKLASDHFLVWLDIEL